MPKKKIAESKESVTGTIIAVISKAVDKATETISNLKIKARNLMAAAVFLISGICIIGLGIGLYINYIFPGLPAGISNIMIGIILVMTGVIFYLLKR